MPAFRTGHPRVRLRGSGTPSLAAGWNVLTWASADYDDEGMWGGGSSVTLDRAGLWMLHTFVQAGTTTAAKVFRVVWRVNDVDQAVAAATSTTSSSMVHNLQYLELATNDVLKVAVQRSDTGTSTVSMDLSYAHILRVGPVRWT